MLCYGITPGDHDWLQAHNDDVETCAAYLQEHEITAALAHPFYAVQAPLTARHRRRLAQLFPIWETRNGSRAKELNLPAFVYIETHGGTAIGGSDDHAGIDIGRTFTQTPAGRRARGSSSITCAPVVPRLMARRAAPRSGPTRRWRSRFAASADGDDPAGPPDPSAVLAIVERVMCEGDARHGEAGSDLGPEDARALLRAWLAAMDIAHRRGRAARAPPGRPSSAIPTCSGGRAASTNASSRRPCPSSTQDVSHGQIRLAHHGARLFDGVRPRDPLRRLGRLPRPREVQADALRRRPAAGRPRRRRPGHDARRDPHDPADSRPRGSGIRGGGDRHRRRCRSAAELGDRDRDPVLPRADARRPRAAGDRRGAGRGPL